MLCQELYKYIKRRKHKAIQDRLDAVVASGRPRAKDPERIFEMPPASAGQTYVIVRRDGAVWAGPWKNDGRSFTRVPNNWWAFKSKERAQREIDVDDFLRHCTVEEAA